MYYALTGGTTVVDPSAWESVITALSSQVSVSTIVGVIASVVGLSIGLVFMWWGVRKAKSALMSAAMKGKLKM